MMLFHHFKSRRDVGTCAEDDITHFHKDHDPISNAKTTPPKEEHIRIPAIWAFEAYTPSYISNFYDGIKELGWNEDAWDDNVELKDMLNGLRHTTTGSDWINLGYIVDEENKTSQPGTRKAKLPDGVESIKASIFQFLPSTTILACKFKMKDDLARLIEDPIRETYSTNKERTKDGYRIIDVYQQKKDAIVLTREYLKNLCTSWLTNNLPGLFSAGYLNGEYPACELIIFEKHVPYQKIDGKENKSYPAILEIENSYYAWECDDLKGVYLQSRDYLHENKNSIVLLGNINEMLASIDLRGYGNTTEDRILNYLNYIDNSLGTWVLLILVQLFEKQVNMLRDKYGEHDINMDVSSLIDLDRQLIELQKNTVPFIHELKDFCMDETCFMHDIFEFKAIHKMRNKEVGLFASIRERLLFYADKLKNNEALLRDAANSIRQITATEVSKYLAKTNIQLQKRMSLMTLVILLLTILTAVSAALEIKKSFDLTIILDWISRLIKYIM